MLDASLYSIKVFFKHVYSCTSTESDWLKMESDFLLVYMKDVNVKYYAFHYQNLKEFIDEGSVLFCNNETKR